MTDATERPGRPSRFSSVRDTCNQKPIKLKTTPDAPTMGADVDSKSPNITPLLIAPTNMVRSVKRKPKYTARVFPKAIKITVFIST